MRAHRPFWHALAAILQIAALLALSIAAPAHARAHAPGIGVKHVHASVDAHAHANHAGIDCAGAHHGPHDGAHAVKVGSDASAPAGDGHSGQCCGLHCPFHIPFVGVADVTVALRWNTERAFRRPRDAAFVSVVPETLPEPPRSFA